MIKIKWEYITGGILKKITFVKTNNRANIINTLLVEYFYVLNELKRPTVEVIPTWNSLVRTNLERF